ncbi:hypothetical protein EJ03DRAFT_199982 [Teratosphaeria nubilosa]|uniref:Uncharacterized protein n=1 Tax=Teratosphaeria nubilosa TaxID=161662 RepID=A0A6G1KZ40_9PEZI|nr:hypothetical protein EJ03DRAFT_199982 [Teratosphaeria nubilosa]
MTLEPLPRSTDRAVKHSPKDCGRGTSWSSIPSFVVCCLKKVDRPQTKRTSDPDTVTAAVGFCVVPFRSVGVSAVRSACFFQLCLLTLKAFIFVPQNLLLSLVLLLIHSLYYISCFHACPPLSRQSKLAVFLSGYPSSRPTSLYTAIHHSTKYIIRPYQSSLTSQHPRAQNTRQKSADRSCNECKKALRIYHDCITSNIGMARHASMTGACDYATPQSVGRLIFAAVLTVLASSSSWFPTSIYQQPNQYIRLHSTHRSQLCFPGLSVLTVASASRGESISPATRRGQSCYGGRCSNSRSWASSIWRYSQIDGSAGVLELANLDDRKALL